MQTKPSPVTLPTASQRPALGGSHRPITPSASQKFVLLTNQASAPSQAAAVIGRSAARITAPSGGGLASSGGVGGAKLVVVSMPSATESATAQSYAVDSVDRTTL